MALRTKDIAAVLSFAAESHDFDGPEALPTELLDRLADLVGCEYATYESFDWPRRAVTAYIPCSYEGPCAVDPHERLEGFWTAGIPPHRRSAVLYKLSDVCSRRERERIRDEGRWNAEFRVVDTVGFRIGNNRTQTGWLHFDSQRRDFDRRDRDLALTMRPHFEALWRKAVSRGQIAELLGALEQDGDTAAGRAIVLVDADGRIDHATAEGRRLLATWFGTHDGRLPPELHEWLARTAPGTRRTERRNGTILALEAAGNFTLTLSERNSDDPGLTPRELEILGLVAEGYSNAEIARMLWVAQSTVAKHLEHAYSKLGVHNRTAAARLATSSG